MSAERVGGSARSEPRTFIISRKAEDGRCRDHIEGSNLAFGEAVRVVEHQPDDERLIEAADRMAAGILAIRVSDGRAAWDEAEIARSNYLVARRIQLDRKNVPK